MVGASLPLAMRTPFGIKVFRYSLAGIVALIVGTALLVGFDGFLRIGAVVSSSLATGIAAIPNYFLNRRWAWGQTGRSHWAKEVLPFWALAFAGWVVSTWAVRLTQDLAHQGHLPGLWTTARVAVVYVIAFGLVSVAKFFIFDRYLFIRRATSILPDTPG